MDLNSRPSYHKSRFHFPTMVQVSEEAIITPSCKKIRVLPPDQLPHGRHKRHVEHIAPFMKTYLNDCYLSWKL